LFTILARLIGLILSIEKPYPLRMTIITTIEDVMASF
jgi:hypothetical protein